ncbi:angiopoietin-related protein 1 [Culex quinquefasciatus]|uniref:angiopoietin-related protein 1 n=1 Tax=Culex quinquefasciatus TaxID=7176 RepID=UPI0018E2E9AF|nr:angiopoietin-related protein 1 [Culex quinquefasciatus]
MFQMFVLLLLLASSARSTANNSSENALGYELLEYRLEYLQKSHDKTSDQLSQILAKHYTMIKRLLNGVLIMTNHSSQLLEAHLRVQQPALVESCRQVDRSGRYTFQLSLSSAPFWVFCEANSFDGGWLVVQQRLDGAVAFNRSWADYRTGFGVVGGASEFWLGLEQLHQLTDNGRYELVVEVRKESGLYGYARYSEFKVAGEGEHYGLIKLGNYFGTVGDELRYHLGKKFSTFDSDNDNWKEGNCAKRYGGGWWYSGCAYSILNGPFEKDAKTGWGIFWTNWSQAATYSRMMIRRK